MYNSTQSSRPGPKFVGLFYYPYYVEADKPISQMIAQKRASK